MPRVKSAKGSAPGIKRRPEISPEARENTLISLAIDLAEKQLREGTASSQVITHYLKLGSTKDRKELEIMDKQIELMDAKTEKLRSDKNMEELYTNAIKAMRRYSGTQYEEVQDDEWY